MQTVPNKATYLLDRRPASALMRNEPEIRFIFNVSGPCTGSTCNHCRCYNTPYENVFHCGTVELVSKLPYSMTS